MNAREKMLEARKLLLEVKESGYWPFASPAPCSTEVKIKDNMNAAIDRIDNAIFGHDQMFTKHDRDDMHSPSATIV